MEMDEAADNYEMIFPIYSSPPDWKSTSAPCRYFLFLERKIILKTVIVFSKSKQLFL